MTELLLDSGIFNDALAGSRPRHPEMVRLATAVREGSGAFATAHSRSTESRCRNPSGDQDSLLAARGKKLVESEIRDWLRNSAPPTP